jgi:hypothetical protein
LVRASESHVAETLFQSDGMGFVTLTTGLDRGRRMFPDYMKRVSLLATLTAPAVRSDEAGARFYLGIHKVAALMLTRVAAPTVRPQDLERLVFMN